LAGVANPLLRPALIALKEKFNPIQEVEQNTYKLLTSWRAGELIKSQAESLSG
jgi:hypothetical protein